jgi:hypothetical protein
MHNFYPIMPKQAASRPRKPARSPAPVGNYRGFSLQNLHYCRQFYVSFDGSSLFSLGALKPRSGDKVSNRRWSEAEPADTPRSFPSPAGAERADSCALAGRGASHGFFSAGSALRAPPAVTHVIAASRLRSHPLKTAKNSFDSTWVFRSMSYGISRSIFQTLSGKFLIDYQQITQAPAQFHP